MDGWKGETWLGCGLTVCGPTKALPAMPERESIRSCDGDGGGDGLVERRRRGRREADRGAVDAAFGRDRKASDVPGLFEERGENFMEFADR